MADGHCAPSITLSPGCATFFTSLYSCCFSVSIFSLPVDATEKRQVGNVHTIFASIKTLCDNCFPTHIACASKVLQYPLYERDLDVTFPSSCFQRILIQCLKVSRQYANSQSPMELISSISAVRFTILYPSFGGICHTFTATYRSICLCCKSAVFRCNYNVTVLESSVAMYGRSPR